MTTPLVVPPCHALARDIVRYVGEPVAFVVADSVESARDAAEAVVVDYEPLPPVVSIADAVLPGAPSIWPEAKDNIAFQFNRGEIGPVEAAIRGAAHVVECELVNNRVVAAPLETRGALGEFDAASGRLHLTASAAGAHAIRDLLADSVFRIAREKLRVSIPDVGGGFGMKNVLYPEWVLVLWAARRLGRPVQVDRRPQRGFRRLRAWPRQHRPRSPGARSRWPLPGARNQSPRQSGRLCLDGGAGRADHGDGERDGRRLRHPADRISDAGRLHQHDAGRRLSRRRQARGELSDRALHRHRGAELGMDALKLRRKNIFRRFPHASAMGLSVEQGSFAHAIDHAVAAAAGFDARRKSSRAQGRLRGLGYACFLETARGQPNEVAEVRLGEDGRIDLKVGTHSNGQGHETTYAQIAADALGLPLERFRFRQGDTDDLDSGGGHGGARSMHQGGTALLMAAEGLIENARRLAARLLQTGVDAVSYEAGMLRVAATGQEISLDEVARASYQTPGDDVAPGLAHRATHLCDRYTFPNGCHVAEVEIDPATGEVKLDRYVIFDDYGRLLDPRQTLGQVHGGVVQGIGQALFEHALFDAETGQILSGSLMDYALPRADDIPSFEGNLTADFPSRANRLGVKGSGQAGAIAAPATIMNAVMNALAPLGVRHLDMPATPFRIWQAIEAVRLR